MRGSDPAPIRQLSQWELGVMERAMVDMVAMVGLSSALKDSPVQLTVSKDLVDMPGFKGRVDKAGNVLPLSEWTDEALAEEIASNRKAIDALEQQLRDVQINGAELDIEKKRRVLAASKGDK